MTSKFTDTLTIAVDAMGGDHGVHSAVPGCAYFLKNFKHKKNVRFLFFGDEGLIRSELLRFPALQKCSDIIHTDKKIKSDDKPSAALRASKGTSMRMAIEAVKNGQADAVISSGNTGALMALAKTVLRPLPGVHRPAIASVFPSMGEPTIMLDLGANVLVDAENLVQFAVMGAAFARVYKNKTLPTIGLLNVGSEDMKGPDHVRAASSLLSAVDFSAHYYGFVEGNDITKGTVDVVVSDGYAGNIALKAAEGVGALTNHLFKKHIKNDPLALIGGVLSYFALKKLKRTVDPRRYNGGVFLGLNGVCVKSHGGSDDLGFASALNLAAGLAEQSYIQSVSDDINHLMSQDGFLG